MDNSNGFIGIWPALSLHERCVNADARYCVQYNSENYNDYYYGVSKNESCRMV
ncbi:MipA/OmpV family protein [Enterobacter cloacae subsp. cloacae]|nr:MipA/OmpV family protein [Enterobacter cloacae subsp. cloacae]